MRKSLLLITFGLFFCCSGFGQSESKVVNLKPNIDYTAEKNYQLIFKEVYKSTNVNEQQLISIKESYQSNTLSANLKRKIIESYIEDSDYKTWPSDIKELGIYLLEKFELENPQIIPFYKQGRKATIRQIGSLMNKSIPELDPNSGVVLSMNQQIQLVRERLPILMSK